VPQLVNNPSISVFATRSTTTNKYSPVVSTVNQVSRGMILLIYKIMRTSWYIRLILIFSVPVPAPVTSVFETGKNVNSQDKLVNFVVYIFINVIKFFPPFSIIIIIFV